MGQRQLNHTPKQAIQSEVNRQSRKTKGEFSWLQAFTLWRKGLVTST